MKYVLDCSLVADWFAPGLLSSPVDRVLPDIKSGKIEAHAPDLLKIEFGHFLSKRVRRRDMSRDGAGEAWADFLMLPIEFHSVGPSAQSAFELAITQHATIYDGCYVALAAEIGGLVLTSDEGMSNAFANGGLVRLVGDGFEVDGA